MTKTLRAIAVVALALAGAGTAFAAGPAVPATGCVAPPHVGQPFLPWGDTTSYVQAVGGSFEPGKAAWSLTGGAAPAAGNEPWYVAGPADHSSLSLPAGSSATSGATCSPQIEPVIRLAVRNVGSAAGRLHVEVLVNGGRGGVLDGGTVTAGAGWELTQPVVVPSPTVFHGASAWLSVRLTPVGAGAAFVVDDVYVDPTGMH